MTLLKTNGEFKSTFDVMKELAAIWPTLDDMMQSKLLTDVAGLRQGNVIASMLNNWKDAESALNTALNSEGSAMREHAKSLDTIQAKQIQLSNTMALMWQNAFNSDMFKTGLTLLNGLAEGLNNLVKHFGLLAPAIAAVTLAYHMFNVGASKGFSKAILSSILSINGLNNTLTLAIGKVLGLTTATEIAATTSGVAAVGIRILSGAIGVLGTMLNALPGMIIFSLIGVALSKVITVWTQHNEEIKRAKQEIDSATQSYNDNRKEVKELQNEYNKLYGNKQNLNTDELNRLISVQDKLAKILPNVATGFDDQGHAILRTADAVNEYINNINKLADLKLEKSRNAIMLSFNDIDEQITNINKSIEETKAQANSNTKTYYDRFTQIGFTHEKSQDEIIQDKQLYIDAQIKQEEAIQDLTNKYNDATQAQLNGLGVLEKLTKADLDYVKALAEHDARLKVMNQTDKSHIDLVDNLSNKMQALARAREIVDTKPTYDTIKGNNGFDTGIIDTYDYRIQLLDTTLKLAGVDSKYAAQMMSDFTKQAKDAITATFDLDGARTDLLKTTEDFIGNHKELSKVYYELNNNRDIALNDIIALLAKTPELTSALTNENGVLRLNKDIVFQVAKAKEAAFKDELKQKEQLLQVQKEDINIKIQNALKEIGLIKSVADVRAGADKMLQGYIDKEHEAGFGLDPETQLSIRQKTQVYQNLVDVYGNATKALEDMQKSNSVLAGVDFTSELGKETNKTSSDDSIPYNLKDYEHQDQLLANQLESLKYQADQFEQKSKATYADKVDKTVVEQFRNFVNQQVETYKQRIALANNALPEMQKQADEYLANYNSETDQSKKNDFGRKYDDQIKQIQTIKNSVKDWEKAITDLTVVQEQNKYKVDTYTASIEDLDNKLNESKNTISKYSTDSKKYTKEITEEYSKQNAIIQQKIDLTVDQIAQLNSEIAANKELLNSGELLQTQFNELLQITDEKEQKVRQLTSTYASLKGELIQNTQAVKDLNKEWYQNADDVATKVIDGIKNALEKEKELATKAIDAIMQKEQEQHDAKTKQLDEELSQYEEVINARLKSIEDQSSKDDYEKQLAKAQKDRAETQKKIDLLSMDNSIEAQAKLVDLKKTLADQDEQIADMKQKHDIDLRKQNLQELLDNKQKDIKTTKQTEDDKYEASKKTLEKMKDNVEAYFDELINDEQHFAKIRKDILSGNVTEVQKELEGYSKTFQDTTTGDFGFLKKQLGTYWDEFNSIAQGKLNNIKASINENLSLAKQLQDLITGTIPPGETNPQGGLGQIGKPPAPPENNTKSNGQQKQTDKQAYLNNKFSWWTEFLTTGVKDNSLSASNDALRKKYPDDADFKDFSKDELMLIMPKFAEFITDFRNYIKLRMDFTNPATSVEKRQQMLSQLLSAEDNWRSKWSQYGIAVPNNLSYEDIISRGLNKFHGGGLAVDEQLGVLKKKELVLDEKDTTNLLQTIQLNNMALSTLKEIKSSSTKQEPNKKVVFNIQNLNLGTGATKQDAKNFVDWAEEQMNKRGR